MALQARQGGVSARSQSESILDTARCLIPNIVWILHLFPRRQIAKYEKCPSINRFLYTANYCAKQNNIPFRCMVMVSLAAIQLKEKKGLAVIDYKYACMVLIVP